MKEMLRQGLFAFLISFFYSPLFALVDYQPLIEQFVRSQVVLTTKDELKVQTFTKKLKPVPACASKLSAFLPYGTQDILRINRIGVICPGQWKQYVPVNIAMISPLVVTTQNIERGQTLQASALTYKKKQKNAHPLGYFTRVADVEHLVAKHRIPAQSVISPRQVSKPLWVKRGEPVTITYNTDSLTVSSKGIAQRAGINGDKIAVKNLQSKKLVFGTVIAPGKVVVQ